MAKTTRVPPGGVRAVFAFRCLACPATFEVAGPGFIFEAERAAGRKGWGLRHGAWRCPDCWIALLGDRERYLATGPEGSAPGGEGC